MKNLALLLFTMALSAIAADRDRSRRAQVAPASCPPEGKGGDPALNQRKNRLESPWHFEPLALTAFAELPSQPFAKKLSRARWPAWWRKTVNDAEARAVSVEGFLMVARSMGPETANCGEKTAADIHFALGESPDAPRARWLVTELTPRVREAHPIWHAKVLRRLSRDHARLRVSGWLLYDHEHLDRIGKNRSSAWEIHPVTKIEVWTDGKWVEL